MSDVYDLAIIGGGPAGYPGAIHAAQLGAKVALIDADKLGGTCLHRGCIPSKIGLHVSELYHEITHASEWGIECSGIKFDWQKLIARRVNILNNLEAGIKGLLKSHKVTYFAGRGEIQPDLSVKIGDQNISAKKIIIATGSTAGRPPIFPFQFPEIVTSEEVFQWKDLPENLLVIGAGPEGCEWACMFAGLGVEVGVLEAQNRLLNTEEPWVSKEIEKIFSDRKIGVFTSVKIESVEIKGKDWVKLNLAGGDSMEVNRVIVATGRRPNTQGLLAKGIELKNKNGFLEVNQQLQTSQPNIYAVGDVNGLAMLAHSATKQALIAVEHALEKNTKKVFDKNAVPGVIFTYPEIARIGATEEQLKQQGKEYEVGRFGFASLGKAMAMGQTKGMVVILSEKGSGKILGASILGPHASDLIHELALAYHARLTIDQVADCIHAHPTLSEAIAEACEDTHGMAIHRFGKKR